MTAPSPPPPVLAYDLLPSGSEITIRHDDAGLVIEIPGERFLPLLRRMLRLPRFWTVQIVIILVQTWPFLWQVQRGGRPMFSSSLLPLILLPAIALIPGASIGLYLVSRRSERIEVVGNSLTSTRYGRFRSDTRRWELDRVRGVRSNSLAVILLVERPATSWFHRPRKVYLMNGLDVAEVAFVAREMRRALNFERPYET